MHADYPSKSPKEAYEQIWTTEDKGTAIHYLDDPVPKERFIIIYGHDDGSVAFDLGVGLGNNIETSDDIMKRAKNAVTYEERIIVAWQLSVVTKSFKQSVMDMLEKFYKDALQEVKNTVNAEAIYNLRHAIINGIGYRGWDEAFDFLESVVKNDPSPELQENAKVIIGAWREVRRRK